MSGSSKETLAGKRGSARKGKCQRFCQSAAPYSDVAEVAKRQKKRPGSRARSSIRTRRRAMLVRSETIRSSNTGLIITTIDRRTQSLDIVIACKAWEEMKQPRSIAGLKSIFPRCAPRQKTSLSSFALVCGNKKARVSPRLSSKPFRRRSLADGRGAVLFLDNAGRFAAQIA